MWALPPPAIVAAGSLSAPTTQKSRSTDAGPPDADAPDTSRTASRTAGGHARPPNIRYRPQVTRTHRTAATTSPETVWRATTFATGVGLGLGLGLVSTPFALVVARRFRRPAPDQVPFPALTGSDSARRSAARALIVVRARTGRPVPAYVTALAGRRTENR